LRHAFLIPSFGGSVFFGRCRLPERFQGVSAPGGVTVRRPYTDSVHSTATRAYIRPRAYVRVQGPDAGDLLQRVVSSDVLAGESCEALLLTHKGRVIAPLVVWRRGDDDFLLLTEPELGETVRTQLERA